MFLLDLPLLPTEVSQSFRLEFCRSFFASNHSKEVSVTLRSRIIQLTNQAKMRN